jgi:hypothetical protein
MAGDPFSELIAGGFSFAGGERANSANAAIARANNAWATEMSNTAYQRQTADMKAAGLNPMLAFGANGASTPSPSQYSASDTVSPAVSSVQAARRLSADLELTENMAKTERSKFFLNEAMMHKAQSERRLLETNTALAASQLPKAQNLASVESGKMAKVLAHVDRFMQSLGLGSNSVNAVLK